MRTGLALMGVFTLFWAAWAVLSGALPLVVLGVVAAGAGVALLVRRARLPAPAPHPTDGPGGPGGPGGGSRTLAVALAVESAAIVVAVVALRSVDPDLIQPAIAVVVGLHFLVFQVDPATRGGLHLVTAGVSVAVGTAGLLAVALGGPAPVVHGLVGLGMTGVTLTYGRVFVRALASPGPAA